MICDGARNRKDARTYLCSFSIESLICSHQINTPLS